MRAPLIMAVVLAAGTAVAAKPEPLTMEKVTVDWEQSALMASKSGEEKDDMEWWKKAVIYQIYPRSFKDSNNDGIGDIRGIIEKVGYLKDLGVDAVWLSPIYATENKDYGYDVTNHTAIHHEYGNMSDFEDLVAEFKKNGIKLIMDFVPNHTSDQHPWFQSAINGSKIYMNYYVLTDKPTNWLSIVDGETAWTKMDSTDQFYYHIFSKYQPDLNYHNNDVKNEMKEVLRFWLKKGVDGFRMDAVPYLVENNDFNNETKLANHTDGGNKYYSYNHTETRDLNETYNIIKEFRSVLDEKYDNNGTKFMVLEATSDINKVMQYYENNNTMPFNFNLMGLNRNSDSNQFKDAINYWLDNLPDKGKWSNWFVGNHDSERVASRMDRNLADAMNMLVLTLPGTPFTYYGEEIAMTNVPLKNVTDQRLCARTPFQWDDTENAGFSNHTPWQAIDTDYWTVNAKVESNKDSHLSVYKSLVKLHKEMIKAENFSFVEISNYTFGFYRNQDKNYYMTVINVDDKEGYVLLNETTPRLPKEFPQDLYIRVGSINSGFEANKDKININAPISLRPMAGLVLSNVLGPDNSGVTRAVPDLFLYSLLLAFVFSRLFFAH